MQKVISTGTVLHINGNVIIAEMECLTGNISIEWLLLEEFPPEQRSSITVGSEIIGLLEGYLCGSFLT